MEHESSLPQITSACHLPPCWARSIQSMPTHPTSWRTILIKWILENRLWARKLEWTDREPNVSVCWLVIYSAGTQISILRHTITVTNSLATLTLCRRHSCQQGIQITYTSTRSGLWFEVFTKVLMKIQALWDAVANRPGVTSQKAQIYNLHSSSESERISDIDLCSIFWIRFWRP